MQLPYIDPEKRYGKKLIKYVLFFRKYALAVEENPNIVLNFQYHSACKFMLLDCSSSTYYRTCYLEALAYGDPGVTLACPSPSLSGLIIKDLGNKDQIEQFYQFLSTNNARTFFALTEPMIGSNASNLHCQLTPDPNKTDNYFLNGEKCLVGNAAVGMIGVVLVRQHAGPLGIRAVLITPEQLYKKSNCITRVSLPMFGLQGAQIGYIRFKNFLIPKSNLLGEHLSSTQKGMMAIIKTFNQLRTGVGALAVGQAQAVLDYFYEKSANLNQIEKNTYCGLYYQLESARQLLQTSAKLIDENPFDCASISIAKCQATRLAVQIINKISMLLGPITILENTWLAKCYRDSYAWEYMEGTTHMQLNNVYQNFKLKQIKNNIDTI